MIWISRFSQYIYKLWSSGYVRYAYQATIQFILNEMSMNFNMLGYVVL